MIGPPAHYALCTMRGCVNSNTCLHACMLHTITQARMCNTTPHARRACATKLSIPFMVPWRQPCLPTTYLVHRRSYIQSTPLPVSKLPPTRHPRYRHLYPWVHVPMVVHVHVHGTARHLAPPSPSATARGSHTPGCWAATV